MTMALYVSLGDKGPWGWGNDLAPWLSVQHGFLVALGTAGLPEADRQKGEDSLNKVEKKQQNRDLRAVCRWVKKNWLLIIITILFIFADTLSKIWMQTDNISIGAFMSSLTTVGLAYITAGFTVSQNNKKS